MRMGEHVDRYVDGRFKRREIGRHSRDRLRSVLTRFADSYGAKDPAKLSYRDIERWLESRSHIAASTRRGEWSSVRCFTRWLTERNVIRKDPMVGKRAPRVPRAAGRALTQEECEAIEAVLPDRRAWAMYALMRYVGLRRGEVVRLQVADWDQRAGLLHIIGKGGHERVEPVPPWAAAHLRAYLAETGARSGALIQRYDRPGPISRGHLGRLFDGWMREAGVKAAPFDGRAPHAFRHTIASELLEAGADIRVVQELLGHQSLTSTQVYLRRASAGRVLEAMERARIAA